MSDVPSKRRRDEVSLNGIPSAMDELKVRELIRDLGNIEKKGLQVRGTQTETARIFEHLTQIMLSNAISETKVRDIAREELTDDEYLQFDTDLRELHGVNQRAHVRYLETSYGQLNDNIRRQPIRTAEENAVDSFTEGVKDVLKKITFGRKK